MTNQDGKAIEDRTGVTGVVALPVVLSALVMVASLDPVAGQGQTPEPQREVPQITFKSSVEVVTVTASVRDGRGRIVRNLTKSDFQVLDAGIPVEIRDFHSGDSPISLAVLLDISGSMSVGGNMDRARG